MHVAVGSMKRVNIGVEISEHIDNWSRAAWLDQEEDEAGNAAVENMEADGAGTYTDASIVNILDNVGAKVEASWLNSLSDSFGIGILAGNDAAVRITQHGSEQDDDSGWASAQNIFIPNIGLDGYCSGANGLECGTAIDDIHKFTREEVDTGD